MEKEERRERDMEITTWNIFYEYHLRRQIGINLEISVFQGWVSQHGQVGRKLTTVYFRGVLYRTSPKGKLTQNQAYQGSAVQETIKPLVHNRTPRRIEGARHSSRCLLRILPMTLQIKLAMKSGYPSQRGNTRHTDSGVGLAKYTRYS
jgi:hypothetical protein